MPSTQTPAHDLTPPAAGRGRKLRRVARRLLIGLAAGIVAGAAMGAVARLLMRLAALAAGEPAGFSWGGTAGILLVFVIFTVPGAVLASLTRRRRRIVGPAVCALALCVPTTAVAVHDLQALSALSNLGQAGVLAATVGIFATVLALPPLTLRLVGRW